ncbi:hypothetical protein J4438_03845 [Candidatus Woesearchaeota archaeon]|nr:hypothetical protein [Candidatus Woesearchaeota archaeon]
MQTKSLNKLQIETAEKLLKDALYQKKAEIADKAFAKDIAKYKPQINELNIRLISLKNFLFNLKRKVEKNHKLEVDMTNYNSIASKIIESVAEADNDNNAVITAKNYNKYNNIHSKYTPNFEKEEIEINQFILGLKLGTALMADLQVLLDKINKLK